MNKIMVMFKRKILPSLGMGLFVIASMAVTGLAAYKLSQAAIKTAPKNSDLTTSQNQQVNPVKQVHNGQSAGVNNNTAADIGLPESFSQVLTQPITAAANNVSLAALNNPLSQPLVTVQPNPANNNLTQNQNQANQQTANTTPLSSQCIITVFGQLYNVTSLRATHPGGDIFQCGADQTAAYVSAHGNNVSRLQPYLIAPASNSTVANNAINNTSNNNQVAQNNQQTNQQNTQQTSSSQNQSSNRCIITIYSQQYDVTSLISSHPGGNVFKCGTDQTALYTSAHGTSVGRLQQYLAVSNTSSSQQNSSTVYPAPSSGSNDNWEDDYEDWRENEHEDD